MITLLEQILQTLQQIRDQRPASPSDPSSEEDEDLSTPQVSRITRIPVETLLKMRQRSPELQRWSPKKTNGRLSWHPNALALLGQKGR